MRETSERLWAVVLAAGEGSRMAALTRRLHGRDLPKQFAALLGDRTLLQLTMERIAPLIPPERTVVVVADAYEALARHQLASFLGVEIVAQPENRGTGPGVLLPLAHVMASDPDARVVIFPSDHHVLQAQAFLGAVGRAAWAADGAASGLALVGAAAFRPAPDLGWIVPGKRRGTAPMGVLTVDRFVEKPNLTVASALLAEGGLWNTMVAAGRGQALWSLLGRCLPEQTAAIARYALRIGQPEARDVLVDGYRLMRAADFSKDVLQSARGLFVVPMVDAGWSDCGTPERLIECLEGTQALATLGARLRQAPQGFSGREVILEREPRTG